MTDDYKEGDNKFTGKIGKVTVELKEVKAADLEEAEQARRVAVVKRGLSN